MQHPAIKLSYLPTIRVESELRERLENLALKEHCKLSELLRLLVIDGTERLEKGELWLP